jgi:hypothetical protein
MTKEKKFYWLIGNRRDEERNMGYWAGFARPIPHIFPCFTRIPKAPFYWYGLTDV